jgi:hypothetical protein
MTLTGREIWTSLHGIVLGGAFLLAFTGAAATLRGLRAEWITRAGRTPAVRWLLAGVWSMAALAWMTAIVGTFVIYPWYRAPAPPNSSPAVLAGHPKSLLVANPRTAGWHKLGMEWKEHVGWLAPILSTAVAVVATRYRGALVDQPRVRQMMLFLLTASFGCAAVAGLLGAMINKLAPVR